MRGLDDAVALPATRALTARNASHALQIAPVTFSETINDLNMLIIEANHAGWACLDNSLAVLSLYLTPFVFGSKYQRVCINHTSFGAPEPAFPMSFARLLTQSLLYACQEMKKLKARIDEANQRAFNPVGLNIRSPSETAFLFLEVRRGWEDRQAWLKDG